MLVDHYHWLCIVAHLEFISIVEVLGHSHLLTTLELEFFGARSILEVDVIDNVGALVTVVGDDALTDELSSTGFLEKLFVVVLAVFTVLVVDLVDPAQNSLGGHEPTAVIKNESTTRLVLVC